jgi:hypothetical protein
MPFVVQCPSCNKRLHAREEFLGKKVKCPACSQSSLLKQNEAVALVRKEFFLSPLPESKPIAVASEVYEVQCRPAEKPIPQTNEQTSAGPEIPKATGAIRTRQAELQRAADQIALKGSLKGSGVGSIILGILAIVMGMVLAKENALNLVLIVLGVVLAVEGTIITFFPRPGGLIFDGIVLIMVGTWNFIVTFANAAQGPGQGGTFWATIGVFQWIWGIQRFLYYRRFAKVRMEEPLDPLVVSWLEQTIAKVKAIKPKKDENAVEFASTNFFGNRKWKGLLLPDGAVLMMIFGGSEILIAPKESLNVTAKMPPKIKPKKIINFTLQSGEHTLKGKIAVEYLLRLQAWREANG